jgi:GDP-4-dehydro-6-deoxy-D-mannose reductase
MPAAHPSRVKVSLRVAVTGGGGFVGQWLARKLLRRGDHVWLSGRTDPRKSLTILAADEWAHVRWISADIRSDHDVGELFREAAPDVLFHLAGMSHVPDAEAAAASAYEVNVVGAVRLLSVAAAAKSRGTSDPVVIVIGSSTQYGRRENAEMPFREGMEQRPVSAYGATKAAQELAALHVARTTGLRVICTRSFSHSGAGQGSGYLLPSLVRRAAELPRSGGIMRIGNDVTRDFLHVEDVVEAYLALSERGEPGEVYNVCSGCAVTVSDLAEEVIRQAGITAEIAADATLQRPTDIPVMVGSPERLMRATGWKPRHDVRDIIADLFAERARLVAPPSSR